MNTTENPILSICENIGIDEETGHLTFAGRDTVALAKKYKTPLYLLDEEYVRNMCRMYLLSMRSAFGNDSYPCFASKALCFKGIYRIMSEEGVGVDVASPGELYTALAAGFERSKIVFHGNNKTDSDIELAVDSGIGHFVCDNREELLGIDSYAKEKGVVQKVFIRVTPGIDPHTHAKINTGRVDSKFGAAIETGQAEELTRYALSLDNIELDGFHCHIGSQIFETEPFTDAARIMLAFIARIKSLFGYEAKYLNLGGGMGVRYLPEHPMIDYRANIEVIGRVVNSECATLGIKKPTVLLEPGRSIVAAAGMTLYTVGAIKQIEGFRNYTSIDGGMADNPRYALYNSPYSIALANRATEEATFACTVAGRCCESGDLIQEDVCIPKPQRGDILAVATTGAYNYSMASNYNRLPRPPIVVLSENGEYIGVARESYEDLIRNDS